MATSKGTVNSTSAASGISLRNDLERVIEGARKEAMALTLDMSTGLLPRNEWEERLTLLIGGLHVAAAQVGMGGPGSMSQEVEEQIGEMLRQQHNFLAAFFALTIATTVQSTLGVLDTQAALLGPSWAGRAASYMDAARVTYEWARYIYMNNSGYTEARRIVNKRTEHCDGCIEKAERGWVPIQELVLLGKEECGQWCACTIQYRRGKKPQLIAVVPSTQLRDLTSLFNYPQL